MHTHIGLLGLEPNDIIAFVSTVNRSITEADDAFSRRLAKQAASLTDEERQELYNDSADEAITLHVCVPFVNRALLITAYSNFEDSLKHLCKDAYARGLSTQSVSETGFYIRHAHNYLASLSKGSDIFDVTALGAKWSEINDGWRHVRNNLVHDNAEVQANNTQRLRTFVDTRPGLSIVHNELVVESRAVEDLLLSAQDVVNNASVELNRLDPPPPTRPR